MPYTPFVFFTMKRVSSRLREDATPLVNSSSKCLIQTVPVGNDQFASRLKVTVKLVFGTENQRLLIALSDQNGTLMSYGTIPAAIASVVKFVNAPVSARVGGSAAPFVAL